MLHYRQLQFLNYKVIDTMITVPQYDTIAIIAYVAFS